MSGFIITEKLRVRERSSEGVGVTKDKEIHLTDVDKLVLFFITDTTTDRGDMQLERVSVW